MSNLKEALDNKICKFTYKNSDDYFFIDVPKADTKIWSPELQLEFVSISENQTQIKGLIGPKPELWTFFIFIHFLVVIIFLGFAGLLYTNSILDKPITIPLTVVILMPIVWLLIYFIGRYLRKKASVQTGALQNFVLDTLVNS